MRLTKLSFQIRAILLGAILLLFPRGAMAVELTEEALFVRCYTQIVGERPALTHPLLNQVRSFQVSALAACDSVLNKATLNAAGSMSNTNDMEARKVIRNFHRLHSSWMSEKDFGVINGDGERLGSRVRFDATTPAMYYTRTLFNSGVNFSSVVTGNQNLEAIRTQQSPNTPIIEFNRRVNNVLETDIFDAVLNPIYAPRGDMLGIRTMANRNMMYRRDDNDPDRNYQHMHRGGGIMGDPVFLTMNLRMNSNFRSNVNTMPRAWSRSVFKDLMCRDLPVVRTNDVNSMVVPGADLGFRRTASCVSCHATMDRAIGVIRNIRYRNTHGRFVDDGIGFNGVVTVATDRNASADRWPSSSDNDYSRRPLDGQLFYRGFAGNLVNEVVTDLGDMGTKMSNQDEIYVCAAKRYYQYLTGIEADIRDIADPIISDTLSDSDQFHRDTVIQLGRDLRQHQNSLQTIRDIMNLGHYRQSDFGVGE